MISHEYNEDGNLIVSYQNKRIEITPDIMAQAWEIQGTQDYSDLNKDHEVYQMIMDYPHQNNVIMISLLLTFNIL